jgi:hypothetical protein
VSSDRLVSVAGDKRKLFDIRRRLRNGGPGIRAQDWQQNAREPYIDGLRAYPVDLAVAAICIFGHRSQETRFEEMQSASR